MITLRIQSSLACATNNCGGDLLFPSGGRARACQCRALLSARKQGNHVGLLHICPRRCFPLCYCIYSLISLAVSAGPYNFAAYLPAWTCRPVFTGECQYYLSPHIGRTYSGLLILRFLLNANSSFLWIAESM